jgi:hypothetical protein
MKKLIVFCLCVLLAYTIRGQSLEPSLMGVTSGTAADAEVTLYFSVGETFIKSQSTAFGFMTEGFLQPELRFPNDLEERNLLKELTLEVFPNPVSSQLRLQLNRVYDSDFYVYVLDFAGKVKFIRTFPAGSLQMDLNMTDLPSGVYLIRLYDSFSGFSLTRKVLKAVR